MTLPFSMSEASAQSTRLAKSTQRAQVRAQAILTRLDQLDSRVSFLRLVISIAVLAVLAAFFPRWDVVGKFVGILGFVLAFFATSFFHKKLQARGRFWKGVVESFSLTQERLLRNLKHISARKAPWHEAIAQSAPAGHVYANDLDIHSHLFSLLDTCATADGSRRLFEVLITEGIVLPQPQERQTRMQRAKVLSRKTRILREMEALRFDEEYLAAYLQFEEQLQQTKGSADASSESVTPGRPRAFGGASSFRYAYALVAIVAWGLMLIPALARFFQTANLEELVAALLRYSVFPIGGLVVFHGLVEEGGRSRRKSGLLRTVLSHMRGLATSRDFTPFSCSSEHAEQQIKRLDLALEVVSLRGNPVLWFFLHLVLPYDALAGLFLTRQMSVTAPRVDAWWNDVREFDFICALARFAAENPTCRFPSSEAAGSTVSAGYKKDQKIAATDLGHPLLAHTDRVTNSFVFEKSAPVVLLTGSNMAGKSTFLRTLGINTLLNNMGAPVCASEFSTDFHRILCAIRVDDSLSEGTSYFYAEVKRLRLILDELSQTSVKALFLIDEIFRGTNNRERFLGSWHLLRSLLSSGTFGVVSTHDLALADLAAHDPRLRNMHFREQIRDAMLDFDYLLREGPCPTTNALHIMRKEGLPIPLHPEQDPAFAARG